jgi:hypothetical protein
MLIDSDIARGVVKVGGGRGFIIEAKHSRLVVTAAHCLPHFPPPVSIAGYDERTYQDLLGALDDPTPRVWAELVFADPIADIAVLAARMAKDSATRTTLSPPCSRSCLRTAAGAAGSNGTYSTARW